MNETNGQQIDASTDPPRKGKRAGALPGNTNRIKHGLRSKRFGLSLGKPPKWARHDVAESRKYQRALETDLLQRYGAIGVSVAGQIISASIHALRLRLALKWLADEKGPDDKPLTLEQRISLLNLAGSATDAKDKVVARLFEKPGLKDDPFACLLEPLPPTIAPTPSGDSAAGPQSSNALEAKPRDLAQPADSQHGEPCRDSAIEPPQAGNGPPNSDQQH